jgi:hypothetical protein
MSRVAEILGRIKDLRKYKDNFLIEVLDDEAIAIMQDRLEEGKQANGNSFPEYSPVTIGIKRAMGGFISKSGNIALKDTGTFYKSMELKKQGSFAQITSDLPLADKLISDWGGDIFDVSVEENNEIFERKREEYIKNMQNFLLS